jgi:drug/metabolite transporter (DMT)-like permease
VACLTAEVTAPTEERSVRRRGQVFVALAAVAWSTAGVLQRELSVDTTTQVAGRALVAFFTLAAFVVAFNRRGTISAFRSVGLAGLGVALCTAVASGSFIVALNHASVANVLFMQAVAPVAAAVLGWIVLGDRISGRTWAAMGVALLGVAIMAGGPGSGGAFGIGVSLLMTVAFAVAIVITRHRREVSMAPAVCLAQLLVVLATAPFAEPGSATARDVGFLLLLGVGQMGLGLAFLTAGARLIPPAEVALITLLEVVLGPLWVWIALSETPSSAAIAGGLVVIVAVILQTTERTPSSVAPRAEPASGAAG